MAKYDYWHLITEVNPDYQKENPGIKVGLVCTHQYKWNHWVTLMNIKTGKTCVAYKLKYLKRLPKCMPLEERCDILKALVEQVKTPSPRDDSVEEVRRLRRGD